MLLSIKYENDKKSLKKTADKRDLNDSLKD